MMATEPPDMEHTPMPGKRRWFQFSLRTFLILLTVFGVWLGLHVRSAKRQKEAVAAIEAYGGWVTYDFQRIENDTLAYDPQAESWIPRWLLSRLGEDFFHDVEMVYLVHPDDIGNVPVDGIPSLDAIPALRVLLVYNSVVNDGSMKQIGGLKHLKMLYIGFNDNEISDKGMVYLEGLTQLEELDLRGTRVTVKGLEQLTGLTSLKRLVLPKDVGDVTMFKRALPNCKIK